MADTTTSRIAAWHRDLQTAELVQSAAGDQLRGALHNAEMARLESPTSTLLTVLLLGPTGSGKSELLNALAGERIAKSHYLRPTTTQPTLYIHESVTSVELEEYSPILSELARQPGCCVMHNRPELRTKVLIDAPDIDSFRTEHRETVLRLLTVVDVALYVVTAFSYKDNIGWETLLAQRGRRAFAFVVNKWDAQGRPAAGEADAEADSDLRSLLVGRSGYAQPLLFRTSAQYWINRRTASSPDSASPPEGDELPQLEAWLSSGLASSEVAQIQSRRRVALWQELEMAITAATPAHVEWKGWLHEVDLAAHGLVEDGRREMQPFLAVRASQIQESRKLRRPPAFGILSALLNTAAGVAHLGRGKLRMQSGDSFALPPSQTMGERLAAVTELRTSSLGWSAQQVDLPVRHVLSVWQTRTFGMATFFDQQLQVAVDHALAARRGKFRRVTAILLLALLELATAALVGVLVWRVAKGYVTANYAQLSLLLSFASLFLVLLALGWAIRTLMFPSDAGRIARELEKPLTRGWKEQAALISADAVAYAAEYKRLENKAEELEQTCANNAESATLSLQTAPGVERLFAK